MCCSYSELKRASHILVPVRSIFYISGYFFPQASNFSSITSTFYCYVRPLSVFQLKLSNLHKYNMLEVDIFN